ncbi:uncharacterized protein Dvir_GJ11776 [Drosophila virilis]|uniref:Uncharacterized protein n=1 Tax=Drosophila virilis TaxID=7244 RepID=A0A0Q9WU40_DROVI|nr:uncharacterized protein Dvir_GJ11776 [Drosophila virilis]
MVCRISRHSLEVDRKQAVIAKLGIRGILFDLYFCQHCCRLDYWSLIESLDMVSRIGRHSLEMDREQAENMRTHGKLTVDLSIVSR